MSSFVQFYKFDVTWQENMAIKILIFHHFYYFLIIINRLYMLKYSVYRLIVAFARVRKTQMI